MSLLIASVVGSTVISGRKTRQANKAREEADEIQKYSDLIDIETQAQSNYITQYNDRRNLEGIEAGQVATSAGMGKRSNSASVVNMQSVAREEQELNFDRMDKNLALSRDLGKLNEGARESATKQKNKASNLDFASGVIRNGLLLKGTE